MKPFVTLSASYGAGGSQIGPALAARLGVPFFDRAIPAQVADQLVTSADNPVLLEERAAGFFERLLSAASASPMAGLPLVFADFVTDEEYRIEVDRVIRGAADGAAGGVLLGRAGAVVLLGHHRVLHVRLDAPQARRIKRLCDELGIDEHDACKQLKHNDGARDAYVRQLYGADARDPALYDLIIDSTSLAVPTCVELIAVAIALAATAISSTQVGTASDVESMIRS